MITKDARRTHGIKSKITLAKEAFNKKKDLFTRKLDLNLRMKLLKSYVCSIASYGAEIWTYLRKNLSHFHFFQHIPHNSFFIQGIKFPGLDKSN
jgi:hypothetical protein